MGVREGSVGGEQVENEAGVSLGKERSGWGSRMFYVGSCWAPTATGLWPSRAAKQTKPVASTMEPPRPDDEFRIVV